MDLVGKMFRNSIRILHVNGILGKSMGDTIYNCSFLDKGLYGYMVAHSAKYREENIMKYFSGCPNTDIILKAERMLSINYVACRSIINSIESVESNDYAIRVLDYGIIIKGPYTANIFKTYICSEPTCVVYGNTLLYKSISEEDYYRILKKVNNLKKDLDELWT